MNELIEIAERNEIKVSQKSKKSYFTIKSKEGETLISFNTGLYNECVPDSAVMLFVDRNSKMDTPPFDKSKDEEQAKATPTLPIPTGISGEERGMWWKQVGGLIVAGKLEEVFGEKDAPIIRRAYKLQAIISLGITAKKEDS